MTNKVSLRAAQNDVGTLSISYKNRIFSTTHLHLKFKKMVRVERKIVVYTWFNFIIDVGSSLGLWLGLSALGITELAIKAFLVAKKWLKVK